MESPNSGLSWVSSICSILGLIFVFVLQTYSISNLMLLFWWITTVVIATAAISVCWNAPSLRIQAVCIRGVFVIVFIAQLPTFNWAWSEIYERDTVTELRFWDSSPEEKKILDLERENSELHWQWKETLLFWQAMAHLTGMGFALLGCTAASQPRISG